MASTRPPFLPVHPEIRYEHSDINARVVMIIGIGILLGTWIFVSLLYFYYDALGKHRDATTAPAPARAAGKVLVPPEPRLQASPPRDLARFRSLEDGQLNSYQWVDRQQRLVSIPITRAMEIVAQQGIAAQKAPPNAYYPPAAGTRRTGLEGKVAPEPR